VKGGRSNNGRGRLEKEEEKGRDSTISNSEEGCDRRSPEGGLGVSAWASLNVKKRGSGGGHPDFRRKNLEALYWEGLGGRRRSTGKGEIWRVGYDSGKFTIDSNPWL